jgi:general secretion pathway protein F
VEWTGTLMTLSGSASTFRYRVVNAVGVEHSGRIVAGGDREARQRLSEQGWLILDLDPVSRASHPGSRSSARDLPLALRMLANLVDCGMPITEALAAFTELAPGSWHNALPEVERAVGEGKSLSQALAVAPSLSLPATVIALVRAGEAGIGLGRGLQDAADWAEARVSDRAALRSALAYPAVVAVAGLISASLLAGVVLPRFARVLADLDQAPPPMTLALLRIADGARSVAVPMALLSCAGLLMARTLLRRPNVLHGWHDFMLGFPLLGDVRFAAASSRTLASLAALLTSGVSVTAAIPLAGQSAGDAAIEQRMLAVGELISSGQSLARALEAARAVSSMSLRLVAAGERSGRLAPMMAHAALLERSRAAATMRQLLRILEPAVLLMIAGAVAVIAAALLQAIYSIKPTP